MPKRAKRAKVNDDPIILVDNPMKSKHAKPPVDEHGLCLANPARVLVVGGCGASKTTTILNCIARGAMWKPWEHIYLMAPTEDVQQGEYGLVDTTFLKELPQLEYFKQRPGRSCLINPVHARVRCGVLGRSTWGGCVAACTGRIDRLAACCRPPPGRRRGSCISTPRGVRIQ